MLRTALLLAGCIVAVPVAASAVEPTTTLPPPPDWYESALAFVPNDHVAGHAFDGIDGDIGLIAIYPSSENDPKTPGSAFARGKLLSVQIVTKDGKRISTNGEVAPRGPNSALYGVPKPGNMRNEEYDYDEAHKALFAKTASLPEGTMPCDIRGYSIDKDRNGLNVRSAPDAKSKALGTLPPPYTFKNRSKMENTPDGGWLTEFSIIGFKNGWFLIEGATPPGKTYEDERVYPRNHPKPYAGRGWVAASKVGAQYANGATLMGGLYQAPHADAKWTPAKNAFGGEISADGGPKRVLACSGYWALVESHDNIRGWWRRLCSNQVTNCS